MTSKPQNLTLLDDGVERGVTIPLGEIRYQIRRLKRDGRGLKGWVGIYFRDTLLSHDSFYLATNDSRRRLVKDAQALLGDDVKTFYPSERMGKDLDDLALWLDLEWEESQVEITTFDPNLVYYPVMQRVRDYVLDEAGTVFYGREDSMKSYLCQIMAVCISSGISSIWDVVQGPVLFINLERSAASYGRRELMIRQALGIREESGVAYIHARGFTLGHVIKKARRYVREHPGCVVFLDSISRGAEGKLIDDETANRFTNMMNGLETSWAAIGHSPKGSKTLFGSVHFAAGEDIGVMVTAGKHNLTRGLCLSVEKANDIVTPPPSYYALDFAQDGSGLIGIRRTVKDEFPDMDGDEKEGDLDKLLAFVEAQDETTTSAAAKALQIPAAKISRLFTKSGKFSRTRRAGHEVYYAINDEWDVAVAED